MKPWRIAAGLILAVCAVVWAYAQGSSRDNAAIEAELLNIEGQWLEAEAKGDLATLDRLFANDFIGTTPGGSIVFKEDVVPPVGGPGHGRLPKSSLKESVVRVYGTTAVVMGLVAVGEATPPGQLRFTKVYLNRDGRWICIAAHLQRVVPPPAE